MYVVRLTPLDGEPDFKAFVRKPDAVKRFDAGRHMVWDNRLDSAALFEVPDVSDPRIAVQAIKDGKADKVVILDKDWKAEVEKAIDDLIEESIAEGNLPSLIRTSDDA